MTDQVRDYSIKHAHKVLKQRRNQQCAANKKKHQSAERAEKAKENAMEWFQP